MPLDRRRTILSGITAVTGLLAIAGGASLLRGRGSPLPHHDDGHIDLYDDRHHHDRIDDDHRSGANDCAAAAASTEERQLHDRQDQTRVRAREPRPTSRGSTGSSSGARHPGGQPPRSNPEKTSKLPNPDFQIKGRYTFGEGWKLENPGPFGEHLSLLVTAKQGDWLEVELPVRPNGTCGSFMPAPQIWSPHASISRSSSPSTGCSPGMGTRSWRTRASPSELPTPRPRPGVTSSPTRSNNRADPNTDLAVSGTNAYSEDMNSFDGGAPQIALHGWNNESAFGRSVSNGCVRVPNEVIEKLSAAPLGTIVDVWAQ